MKTTQGRREVACVGSLFPSGLFGRACHPDAAAKAADLPRVATTRIPHPPANSTVYCSGRRTVLEGKHPHPLSGTTPYLRSPLSARCCRHCRRVRAKTYIIQLPRIALDEKFFSKIGVGDMVRRHLLMARHQHLGTSCLPPRERSNGVRCRQRAPFDPSRRPVERWKDSSRAGESECGSACGLACGLTSHSAGYSAFHLAALFGISLLAGPRLGFPPGRDVG